MLKKNVVQGNFDAENLKDDEVIISNYGNVEGSDKKKRRISFFDINVGDQINIKDNSNSEQSNKNEGLNKMKSFKIFTNGLLIVIDNKYIIPYVSMLVGIMVVVIMVLLFSVVSVVKIEKQNIVVDIKE